MTDIPNAIRNARLASNLTQKELADRIGESQQYLDKIEHGQRVVTLPTAIRIAAATGMTLDELVKEENGNGN